MDFFQCASVAAIFTNSFLLTMIIGGLCFAILFVFEAIALFTIASREGYKNKWMAFIPFFNTYYIGVCGQKNKLYNVSAKTIAIVASVFEFALVALYIFYYITVYVVLKDCTIVVPDETGYYSYIALKPGSAYPEWAAFVFENMNNYILSPLMLVWNLIRICLLICFFQTYACRRYVIFTLASVLFPIVQGILFFVIRNNKGVNYKEYVRAEQARQYRIYQQYQQNMNQNPYNNNSAGGNPYSGQTGGTPPAEDPFGDFNGGGSSGSPFDEFDNK